MDEDKQFTVIGDKARFCLEWRLLAGRGCEFAPEQSANSWGEWRLWVANVNLCSLQLETERGTVNVEEVRWYLAPLFRWFIYHWMPLLHEKRLPPGGRSGDSRPRSARGVYLAMLQSAGDDESRFPCWQEWAERHSLRTAAEGGIVPDVFFQRIEDEIEISWGDRMQPRADSATFLLEDGVARAMVDDVAETLSEAVNRFLEQEPILDTQWGAELANRWHAQCRSAVGESALSWYLDSDSKPGLLTRTFMAALKKLNRPLELTEKMWLGELSPEVAMFGDLAPDIDREAAARLLAAYFGSQTTEPMQMPLAQLIHADETDEPAWSNPFPWSSGYSRALDVLEELDPDTGSPMTKLEKMLDNLKVEVQDISLGEKGPRGVALAGKGLRPTILVNEDNPTNKARGRRFTLAHELCHILFDQDRARPLAHSSTPWASPAVEQRANAFAAMLLMPPNRAKRPIDDNLEELKKSINRMADQMQVSRIALKRHLSNMDEINPQELEYLLGERACEV